MIVIATHEGYNFIEPMLNSLVDCSCNEKIVVVDTLSSKEYLKYLQINIKDKFKDIEISQTPYAGYDSGAWIYAYRNYIEDHYIFLHDSMIIQDKSIIEKIINGISDNIVMSFVGFGNGGVGRNYDTKEDEMFVQKHCGTVEFKDGIFGPMFGVKRSVMEILDRYNHLIIPSKKSEQRAMERLWPVVFNIHNIEIHSISRFNSSSYYNGEYGIFKKIHTYTDR